METGRIGVVQEVSVIFAYIDPGTGFTITTVGGGLAALAAGFLGIILTFFSKHRKTFAVIFAIIVLLTAIWWAFQNMDMGKTTLKGKIVILGFDGLSPDIVEPMMASGELPNFASLKKKGSYDRLETTNPAQSPVAWASFATGKNPAKTGVFDFIVRDPKDHSLKLSLSDFDGGKAKRVIKEKCFWEYLSEKKIPSIIISHPLTFPPDKIYGRMLSGMGTTDILGTEGTFYFYTTEPVGESGDIGGMVFHIDKNPVINMDIIGPRVAASGKSENVKVPFKVSLGSSSGRAMVELDGRKFEIEKGKWSDWKEINFKLGPFKGAKGTFKFFLVETDPEFKLYVSPVSFDPRDPFFQISSPGSYAKELADKVGLYNTRGMPADTWAVNEKRLDEKALLEQLDELLEQKKAMLNFELERFKNGLLFCYFGTSDIVQHMFWRYTDPEHPLHEKDAPRECKEAIRGWYKKLDGILGEVMAHLGGNDTLMVLSDHGFDTYRRSVHVNTWLKENGYFDADLEKAKAYSISFGAIYINQKEEESAMLKNEIAGKLKNWVDSKTGGAVVNNVYKREEIFWGKYLDETPDLYIGFNKGYTASWQTALGEAPGSPNIIDNPKKWSGSHLFDPKLIPGVLFCNKKITKENPSIYDITPTILKLTGESNAEIEKQGFDGKILM